MATTSSPSTSQNGQTPSTSTASCPDPEDVAVITMRKAVGALLDNVGFTHAQEGPLNVITDVAIRFMEKLCKEVKLAGEYCGRSQPAMDDLSHAFSSLKFDKIDFHAYLNQVSSIAPIPPLPLFPVDLPKCHRINGYKASREEKKNRPPHIPRFLPGIRPSGEEREDAHVAIPCSSTSLDPFDNLSFSFEKSKSDYLTRFEGDVPGFFGAETTNYGMKKTDKDKNPPVLVVMKGRKTEEEKRRIEEERSRREPPEIRIEMSGTNGIHHKFKKHKEKDKEKPSSRPPSTLKAIEKPPKIKTPHKIKKDEKSRTSTPIVKENTPLLPSDFLDHGGITPIKATPTKTEKSEKMEREPPRPLLSLNLFDDPAEETDIPLPRTPGRHRTDSPEEDLFFDPDPFGRMSYNAPSSSTPYKSTPTMRDDEKRRKEKEEKRARKEEKKAKKAAEESKRIEMEKLAAEREAMKEAQRVAAREEAKERERAREKSRELQRLEKERKEREKEEQRRAEKEMQRMLDEKKEQIRLQAAQLARTITEDNERKQREREAREKKRKEEKERAKIEARRLLHAAKKEARRSETPRVDTPKPRELEAIRLEEDKDDSSTIPCMMEDIPDTSFAPVTGPTSFPLNMSLHEPTPKEERTVTPIKIKKHGEERGEGERDGEKTKKKHKKDKKERDEDMKDPSSNRDEDERRERKKAKKREKREREERERLEKEKRVDQSPIQDKIDPNKSSAPPSTGLKLTIKLGGVTTLASPPLISAPVHTFASHIDQIPTSSNSLLKLKIRPPIDLKMETPSSSTSLPLPTSMAAPKPRPVTKAELKATPESAPSLFQEERSWKHKHKKHKHSKASGSDSSSSSDEEERKERERRRKAKKEKERMEREREREEEERRIREKERREREKEREERERMERIKAEREARERIEKEKREREREREREKEKEKQKKKQTAFDLALQASSEKKKRKKEEEKVEVIWICPVCSVAYVDGAEMIGCDCCDSWFHWQCVGLVHVPEGDAPWFCERCTPKNGELPNYGKNKKKCTHWSGQYMDWNIKKSKKSHRDYSP